jgi:hypothetical protein
MTDEQIIALIPNYFTEGGIQDDGSCSEWYGNSDAFLKFAQAIHENGYNKGYEECSFDMGDENV